MIKVTRIAGESFDFETRQELPKAIILSNGKREYTLYVGDEVAKDVLELMLEVITPPPSPKKEPSPAKASSKPKASAKAPAKTQSKAPPAEEPSQFMAAVGETFAQETDDNNSREPGEEYNDPATGVESL